MANKGIDQDQGGQMLQILRRIDVWGDAKERTTMRVVLWSPSRGRRLRPEDGERA